MVAPQRKLQLSNRNSLEYQTYKYKVYHPSFPHEPTSDQFFDDVQWESYYRLGQYIGSDVLGVKGLLNYFTGKKEAPQFTIDELLWRFDENIDLFQLIPEEPPVEKSPAMALPDVELPTARGVSIDEDTTEADEPKVVAEETTQAAAKVDDPEFEAIPTETKIVVGGEDDYSM